MSIRIAVSSGKGLQYDIRTNWPDGTSSRERGKCPAATVTAAKRWAEARAAHILLRGPKAKATKVDAPSMPTFGVFWPRVLEEHYTANRKKASTTAAAESIAQKHLLPAFGAKTLDTITTSDVQALKGRLADKGPKTVNNVLSVLSRALKCALDWDVITEVPCKFGLLTTQSKEKDFYEVPVYRRLVAASDYNPDVRLLVLLAGSAGLRRGEIIALRWADVDFERRLLHVKNATWQGVEAAPKGNRGRVLPLTEELLEALRRCRSMKERVLYSASGGELTARSVRNMLAGAQKKAGLKPDGGIHILRHTFCSHLALAGVPAKTVQDLAGHADLKTTLGYLHLSPQNRSAAMDSLTSLYGEGT